MIKLSGKPISSPGRPDNFPPPLMRFLRSSAGSRSRGSSRASPMLLKNALQKSSSSSVATEPAQEPSSPKVTCMGQVRTGRSEKSTNRKPEIEADENRCSSSSRCAWISRSLLLCNYSVGRWKRSSSRGRLRRVDVTRPWLECTPFFHVAVRRRRRRNIGEEEESSCSKAETEPKFPKNRVIGVSREGDESELKREEEDEEAEAAGARAFGAESSSPCSPPKNALLLTRCKSAPYRSSSLAYRFWGSPISGAGEAQRPGGEESAGEGPEHMLVSEKEATVHPAEEDDEAAADEEKARCLNEEVTVIVAEKMTTKIGEVKMKVEQGLRPPARLTRCKSEPARTTALKAGCR